MALFRRPVRHASVGRVGLEVWVRERAFPTTAESIVVPVAPSLRMVSGIAKWVRDATAGKVEEAARLVAPLGPGEAFAGCGGKYRFGTAALAVVMDEYKRTTPDWISAGIARALHLCAERGATTCLLPDMTEDLLRQPAWITDEQRRETCRPIARAMLDGVAASEGVVGHVMIWVWRKVNEDIWLDALDEYESAHRHPAGAHA